MHNLYDLEMRMRQRPLEEATEARRHRLAERPTRRQSKRAPAPIQSHPLRARLGLKLIRLGVWLAS